MLLADLIRDTLSAYAATKDPQNLWVLASADGSVDRYLYVQGCFYRCDGEVTIDGSAYHLLDIVAIINTLQAIYCDKGAYPSDTPSIIRLFRPAYMNNARILSLRPLPVGTLSKLIPAVIAAFISTDASLVAADVAGNVVNRAQLISQDTNKPALIVRLGRQPRLDPRHVQDYRAGRRAAFLQGLAAFHNLDSVEKTTALVAQRASDAPAVAAAGASIIASVSKLVQTAKEDALSRLAAPQPLGEASHYVQYGGRIYLVGPRVVEESSLRESPEQAANPDRFKISHEQLRERKAFLYEKISKTIDLLCGNSDAASVLAAYAAAGTIPERCERTKFMPHYPVLERARQALLSQRMHIISTVRQLCAYQEFVPEPSLKMLVPDANNLAPAAPTTTFKRRAHSQYYIVIPTALTSCPVNAQNFLYLFADGVYKPRDTLKPDELKDYGSMQRKFIAAKMESASGLLFRLDCKKFSSADGSFTCRRSGLSVKFVTDIAQVTSEDWHTGRVLCVILSGQTYQFKRAQLPEHKTNEEDMVYVLKNLSSGYYFSDGTPNNLGPIKRFFKTLPVDRVDTATARESMRKLWDDVDYLLKSV